MEKLLIRNHFLNIDLRDLCSGVLYSFLEKQIQLEKLKELR